MSMHVLLRYSEWGLAVGVVLLALGLTLHRFQAKSDFDRPGLFGVVGRMGSGKSYFFAYIVYRAVRRGRWVGANFTVRGAHLIDHWLPTPAEAESWAAAEAVALERGLVDRYGRPDRFAAGYEFSGCLLHCPGGSLVVIDEAQQWWPSDAWKAPVVIRQWVTHIRKSRQSVYWGSQDRKNVSRWLRELAFGIWECSRFRSGHSYSLYDPAVSGTGRNRKAELRVVLRRSPRVMKTYDTYEVVATGVEWAGADQLVVHEGA